jgi:hypothetical protein
MLKETLRIIAVLLLLLVAIADDFPFYKKMKNPITQLVIGMILIGLIFYDSVFGFIMGLVLMLIYYEIYKKIKKIKENESSSSQTKKEQNDAKPIMLDYLTNEHLIAAQNNIVKEENYNTEVKGVLKGFNNEGMYSAQGIDKENLNKAGYDYTDKYFSYE